MKTLLTAHCAVACCLFTVACGPSLPAPSSSTSPTQGSPEPGGSTGTTAGSAGTTGGNGSTSGSSTAGTTGGSGSTGGTFAAVDFEDGTLHGWQVVNGIDQVQPDSQAAPASSNSTWGIVGSQVTAPAHGGKSFAANVGGAYTDAVLLRNTAGLPHMPNHFYARFYIKLQKPLVDTHTTFAIAAGTGGGASGNNLTEVRMGGQFSYLVANLQLNDAQRRSGGNAGDPESAPGIKLTANQWYCMEIDYDGVTPSMHTWLDGNEVTNLDVQQASDWSSTPSTTQWMPTITEFKLGWQSYGSTPNTVYLDDVALSTSRIGCLSP